MIRLKSGFTRIALLSVVLAGIAAAVAISRLQNRRANRNAVTLIADLRKLWTAQEAYLNAHSSYASSLSDLPDVLPSPGVVLSIGTATAGGWSARAERSAPGRLTCAIFTGSVPKAAPATVEGIIACR